GLRRRAEAARPAARGRLRRAVRGSQGRRAGGEAAAERGPRRLPRGARQGGQRQRRLPRERANAAGGARRMRAWPLVFVAAFAACSTPSGPQPAQLPQLKESAKVREVWSASAGSADSFVFEPAFADGAVY